MSDSYLVTHEWSDRLEDIVGKFEVAPTPEAQAAWEIVKKSPHFFEFGISYMEKENGEKELIGISLIRALPNPIHNLETPPK
jgi:hypothetical protein